MQKRMHYSILWKSYVLRYCFNIFDVIFFFFFFLIDFPLPLFWFDYYFFFSYSCLLLLAAFPHMSCVVCD